MPCAGVRSSSCPVLKINYSGCLLHTKRQFIYGSVSTYIKLGRENSAAGRHRHHQHLLRAYIVASNFRLLMSFYSNHDDYYTNGVWIN